MNLIKLHIYLVFVLLQVVMPLIGQNQNDLLRAKIAKKDDTIKVNKLIDLSIKEANLGNHDKALLYCNDAIKISNDNNFSKHQGTAYRISSGIYLLNNDLINAQNSGLIALTISKKRNDKTEQFKNHINLGEIFTEKGENRKALDQYLEALSIVDLQKNETVIGKFYNSLGELHDKLKNYDKAIMYEKIALKHFETSNELVMLSNTLSHIGISYLNKKSIDTALTYFFKSIRIKTQIKDIKGMPPVYNNIGIIYAEKNNLKKALIYYTAALKGITEYNQKNIEAAIYNNIGEAYLQLNEYKKAEFNLKKALEISASIGYNYSLMNTYQSLSELSYKTHDHEKALFYYKKYTSIKDTIFDIEKTIDINEKLLNSESELKDKKIEILNTAKAKNDAETEKDIAVRNLVIAIVFSLASLLIFLIVTFNNKDKRSRQKIFLRQLIQFQEDERKRISKELHDGIGQSLLVIKNNMTDDKSLIENTIDELRAISRNLHPIQLEKLGLKNAIESIVKEASMNTSIYFSCDIEDINESLNPEKQINIYRIIQECVSNIIKHSNASYARITFFNNKENLVLTIYDNGKGFELTEIKKKNTIGLTSIEERVKLIGGQLSISSKKNETKIEILISYA